MESLADEYLTVILYNESEDNDEELLWALGFAALNDNVHILSLPKKTVPNVKNAIVKKLESLGRGRGKEHYIDRLFISAHGMPGQFDIASNDPNSKSNGVVGSTNANLAPVAFGMMLKTYVKSGGQIWLLSCDVLGKKQYEQKYAGVVEGIANTTECQVFAFKGLLTVNGNDESPVFYEVNAEEDGLYVADATQYSPSICVPADMDDYKKVFKGEPGFK